MFMYRRLVIYLNWVECMLFGIVIMLGVFGFFRIMNGLRLLMLWGWLYIWLLFFLLIFIVIVENIFENNIINDLLMEVLFFL